MNDLRPIQAKIDAARRRLRLQRALNWATTAAIPAVSLALVDLWLWRMRLLPDRIALGVAIALVVVVGIVAVVASLGHLPTDLVATRIDRASGLSDRLTTAMDFERKLRGAKEGEHHPETAALMQKAIEDGLRAAPQANVKAAAPFQAPQDVIGFSAVTAIAVLFVLLNFGADDGGRRGASLAIDDRTGNGADLNPTNKDGAELDVDDLDFSRDFVKDMKELAEQSGDRHLTEFADALEKLLEKAEKGELSKEELMAKMEALEKQYMEGADQDIDAMLEELKEMSKELKKEEATKELGEALEAGDMEQAAKEMEELAEKMDKGELKPEQEKKVAEALEKAVDKAEEKRKQKEEKQDKQAAKDQKKKEDEIRKLQKKSEENPQDQEAKRQLEKKKRELDELKRQNEEKKKEARKRSLERLQRNMKKSAEHLKNKKNQQNEQDKQEQNKQAAENMKNSADDARKVEDEVRKIGNQKRVKSQLADLKDAIRRAKPRKGGQGQRQAQRLQDYKSRAQGGQGNPQAWRQGNGKQGMGQKGQGQNDPNGQPGNGIGDSADPNLMGDPTALASKKKNEELDGLHGRGPSRRETIITAAKKGFATTAYKKVYADYKKLVEEVIKSEKVPQGYKYYVKRYFQRIKPHNME